MKKSLLAIAVILAFALTTAAQTSSTSSNTSSGQSASSMPSTSSDQTSSDKTATSTGKKEGITGCLEQGSSPGSYVIKNAKHPDGVQVSYSGSEDLSKHVGHKVHATGTMSGDTLTATNVRHISESCNVSSAGGHMHHHGSSGESSNTSTGGTSGTGTSNPK